MIVIELEVRLLGQIDAPLRAVDGGQESAGDADLMTIPRSLAYSFIPLCLQGFKRG